MKIRDITVEYQHNPMGLDTDTPRFAWKLVDSNQNTFQKAYHIQVSKDKEFQELIWDSQKVNSGESIQIAYNGETLSSFTEYFWRVKAWDQEGMKTDWSDMGRFEMAMMSWKDWEADWITPEYDYKAPKTACPILRKEFQIGKQVAKARIYVTAKGLYELRLNGKKVGRDFLTPGWTSYNKRTLYQVYDVTDMLKEGGNAIGATIGSGWYKGELGWRSRRNLYGGREALIMELHLTYEDGTVEKILSDGTWQSSYRGPVVYSEIYHGETYDARKEIMFDTCDCDFSDWFRVRVMGTAAKDILHAQECPPVRKKLVLHPIQLLRAPNGQQILDMGQNMAGHVRFRVKGKAGERVVLRHGEILDSEGNFYDENLKGARQRVEYILKDEQEVTFEPHFTYQGFRYVLIEEYPGEIRKENFEGIVLYSDMPQTGTFRCSDENLQQLTENILWGQRGNFVDIPTDCPQRCERLGWTGDIQIFCDTAALQMETALFLRKWLHDVAAEQFPSGGVPWVVPDVYDDTYAYDLVGYTGQSEKVAAAWGDCATVVPWNLYQAFGDKRILEEQFDSMKKYVEFIRSQGPCEYTWEGQHQLGDWVALDAPYGSFVGATDVDFVATAYFAKSTEILYKTAKVIEREEEYKIYQELYHNIIKAFRKKYVDKDGELKVKTQTALVLAAHFGLVSDELAANYMKKLAEWLKETNYDLITGFVGTPYICHALTKYGQVETAYKLLFKKEYPSWMYQVTKGATTVWEHLDGIRPDGTLWNPRMNSFNHYAYGSVAEWIYRGITGLKVCEDGPGYRKFRICPKPGKELDSADFTYESMYGRITSGWKRTGDKVEYHMTVPVNTTAEVRLAGVELLECQVPYRKIDDEYVMETGSGDYCFIMRD